MLRKFIPMVAIAALVLAAAFLLTTRKPPEACGDIFGRADTEWNTTCEISK